MDLEEEKSLSLGTEASVPPPSPLTGCYLLIVIGEPHTSEHKEIILQKLIKGLLSWDSGEHQVDLEKELATITAQAPEGEDARNGERLIQFASENLVTEILIHPQMNTLMQCMRNLLSSFTRHRHLIHAGYTFAGNGSWIMQDGTFSLSDFTDAYQENEVQRVIRAYENSISIDVHCSTSGGGEWAKLPEMPFVKYCKIRVNPTDLLDTSSQAIKEFVSYVEPYIVPASLEQLLVPTDVVGNIRFSHPTLYIFPGGQGDAALFGINGFNMLVDGGFSRKSCWWDFARHLDRLDAVLLTRINNCSIAGMASVIKRKAMAHVYPQIGHFFCNLEERRVLVSPDGDKDADPLLVSLLQEGSDLMADIRHINLKPQHCYRGPEPINLYHKVGHGTLDMYVLNPSKDSKYVRDFLKKWHSSEQKLFEGANVSSQFSFPIPNLVSICALLIWRPAKIDDPITRIMFPGSTPQHKIFEGLEKLKHLELLQHPKCTGRQIAASVSPVPSTITSNKVKPLTRITKERTITTEKKDDIIKSKHDQKIVIDNKLINELADGEDKKIESILQDVVSSKVEIKTDNLDNIDGISKKIKTKKNYKSDKLITEGKKAEDDLKFKPDVKKKIDFKTTSETKKSSRSVKSTAPDKKMNIQSSDTKTPPATPKKITELKTTKETPVQTAIKIKQKTRKLSPSTTPAKSAKEAMNRKVVESKYKQILPKRDLIHKPQDKKETKTKREPISRRPRAVGSPLKTSKSSKSPVLKNVADSKLKGLQRVNYEDILKDAKKSDEETSKSIDEFKHQELDDKEEQEIVREIEAVFNRDSEAEDKVEFVGRSDIEKITCMIDDTKTETTADGEFEEEYLIIEKEEIDQITEDLTVEREDRSEKLLKHIKNAENFEKSKVKSSSQMLTDAEKESPKDQSESIEEKQDLSSEKKSPESKSDKIKDINIMQTSQPDEKGSTTIESGGTTTAPTLPEDERIPLGDIKEDKGEDNDSNKYKKEIPPYNLKEIENFSKIKGFVETVREIVKTPDEVADLPIHEEVDYRSYEEKNLIDDVFKRKPELGFVREIEPSKDFTSKEKSELQLGLTTMEDDVVIKTLDTVSHAEVVTVTPGSAPESPMYPYSKSMSERKDQKLDKEYYGYTAQLRETHITTLESPSKDVVTAEDIIIPCQTDKIPSIPEDIEKEIEETYNETENIKNNEKYKSPTSIVEVEVKNLDETKVLKPDRNLDKKEAPSLLLTDEKEKLENGKDVSPAKSLISDMSEISGPTVISDQKSNDDFENKKKLNKNYSEQIPNKIVTSTFKKTQELENISDKIDQLKKNDDIQPETEKESKIISLKTKDNLDNLTSESKIIPYKVKKKIEEQDKNLHEVSRTKDEIDHIKINDTIETELKIEMPKNTSGTETVTLPTDADWKLIEEKQLDQDAEKTISASPVSTIVKEPLESVQTEKLAGPLADYESLPKDVDTKSKEVKSLDVDTSELKSVSSLSLIPKEPLGVPTEKPASPFVDDNLISTDAQTKLKKEKLQNLDGEILISATQLSQIVNKTSESDSTGKLASPLPVEDSLPKEAGTNLKKEKPLDLETRISISTTPVKSVVGEISESISIEKQASSLADDYSDADIKLKEENILDLETETSISASHMEREISESISIGLPINPLEDINLLPTDADKKLKEDKLLNLVRETSESISPAKTESPTEKLAKLHSVVDSLSKDPETKLEEEKTQVLDTAKSISPSLVSPVKEISESISTGKPVSFTDKPASPQSDVDSLPKDAESKLKEEKPLILDTAKSISPSPVSPSVKEISESISAEKPQVLDSAKSILPSPMSPVREISESISTGKPVRLTEKPASLESVVDSLPKDAESKLKDEKPQDLDTAKSISPSSESPLREISESISTGKPESLTEKQISPQTDVNSHPKDAESKLKEEKTIDLNTAKSISASPVSPIAREILESIYTEKPGSPAEKSEKPHSDIDSVTKDQETKQKEDKTQDLDTAKSKSASPVNLSDPEISECISTEIPEIPTERTGKPHSDVDSFTKDPEIKLKEEKPQDLDTAKSISPSSVSPLREITESISTEKPLSPTEKPANLQSDFDLVSQDPKTKLKEQKTLDPDTEKSISASPVSPPVTGISESIFIEKPESPTEKSAEPYSDIELLSEDPVTEPKDEKPQDLDTTKSILLSPVSPVREIAESISTEKQESHTEKPASLHSDVDLQPKDPESKLKGEKKLALDTAKSISPSPVSPSLKEISELISTEKPLSLHSDIDSLSKDLETKLKEVKQQDLVSAKPISPSPVSPVREISESISTEKPVSLTDKPASPQSDVDSLPKDAESKLIEEKPQDFDTTKSISASPVSPYVKDISESIDTGKPVSLTEKPASPQSDVDSLSKDAESKLIEEKPEDLDTAKSISASPMSTPVREISESIDTGKPVSLTEKQASPQSDVDSLLKDAESKLKEEKPLDIDTAKSISASPVSPSVKDISESIDTGKPVSFKEKPESTKSDVDSLPMDAELKLIEEKSLDLDTAKSVSPSPMSTPVKEISKSISTEKPVGPHSDIDSLSKDPEMKLKEDKPQDLVTARSISPAPVSPVREISDSILTGKAVSLTGKPASPQSDVHSLHIDAESKLKEEKPQDLDIAKSISASPISTPVREISESISTEKPVSLTEKPASPQTDVDSLPKDAESKLKEEKPQDLDTAKSISASPINTPVREISESISSEKQVSLTEKPASPLSDVDSLPKDVESKFKEEKPQDLDTAKSISASPMSTPVREISISISTEKPVSPHSDIDSLSKDPEMKLKEDKPQDLVTPRSISPAPVSPVREISDSILSGKPVSLTEKPASPQSDVDSLPKDEESKLIKEKPQDLDTAKSISASPMSTPVREISKSISTEKSVSLTEKPASPQSDVDSLPKDAESKLKEEKPQDLDTAKSISASPISTPVREISESISTEKPVSLTEKPASPQSDVDSLLKDAESKLIKEKPQDLDTAKSISASPMSTPVREILKSISTEKPASPYSDIDSLSKDPEMKLKEDKLQDLVTPRSISPAPVSPVREISDSILSGKSVSLTEKPASPQSDVDSLLKDAESKLKEEKPQDLDTAKSISASPISTPVREISKSISTENLVSPHSDIDLLSKDPEMKLKEDKRQDLVTPRSISPAPVSPVIEISDSILSGKSVSLTEKPASPQSDVNSLPKDAESKLKEEKPQDLDTARSISESPISTPVREISESISTEKSVSLTEKPASPQSDVDSLPKDAESKFKEEKPQDLDTAKSISASPISTPVREISESISTEKPVSLTEKPASTQSEVDSLPKDAESKLIKEKPQDLDTAKSISATPISTPVREISESISTEKPVSLTEKPASPQSDVDSLPKDAESKLKEEKPQDLDTAKSISASPMSTPVIEISESIDTGKPVSLTEKPASPQSDVDSLPKDAESKLKEEKPQDLDTAKSISASPISTPVREISKSISTENLVSPHSDIDLLSKDPEMKLKEDKRQDLVTPRSISPAPVSPVIEISDSILSGKSVSLTEKPASPQSDVNSLPKDAESKLKEEKPQDLDTARSISESPISTPVREISESISTEKSVSLTEKPASPQSDVDSLPKDAESKFKEEKPQDLDTAKSISASPISTPVREISESISTEKPVSLTEKPASTQSEVDSLPKDAESKLIKEKPQDLDTAKSISATPISTPVREISESISTEKPVSLTEKPASPQSDVDSLPKDAESKLKEEKPQDLDTAKSISASPMSTPVIEISESIDTGKPVSLTEKPASPQSDVDSLPKDAESKLKEEKPQDLDTAKSISASPIRTFVREISESISTEKPVSLTEKPASPQSDVDSLPKDAESKLKEEKPQDLDTAKSISASPISTPIREISESIDTEKSVSLTEKPASPQSDIDSLPKDAESKLKEEKPQDLDTAKSISASPMSTPVRAISESISTEKPASPHSDVDSLPKDAESKLKEEKPQDLDTAKSISASPISTPVREISKSISTENLVSPHSDIDSLSKDPEMKLKEDKPQDLVTARSISPTPVSPLREITESIDTEKLARLQADVDSLSEDTESKIKEEKPQDLDSAKSISASPISTPVREISVSISTEKPVSLTEKPESPQSDVDSLPKDAESKLKEEKPQDLDTAKSISASPMSTPIREISESIDTGKPVSLTEKPASPQSDVDSVPKDAESKLKEEKPQDLDTAKSISASPMSTPIREISESIDTGKPVNLTEKPASPQSDVDSIPKDAESKLKEEKPQDLDTAKSISASPISTPVREISESISTEKPVSLTEKPASPQSDVDSLPKDAESKLKEEIPQDLDTAKSISASPMSTPVREISESIDTGKPVSLTEKPASPQSDVDSLPKDAESKLKEEKPQDLDTAKSISASPISTPVREISKSISTENLVSPHSDIDSLSKDPEMKLKEDKPQDLVTARSISPTPVSPLREITESIDTEKLARLQADVDSLSEDTESKIKEEKPQDLDTAKSISASPISTPVREISVSISTEKPVSLTEKPESPQSDVDSLPKDAESKLKEEKPQDLDTAKSISASPMSTPIREISESIDNGKPVSLTEKPASPQSDVDSVPKDAESKLKEEKPQDLDTAKSISASPMSTPIREISESIDTGKPVNLTEKPASPQSDVDSIPKDAESKLKEEKPQDLDTAKSISASPISTPVREISESISTEKPVSLTEKPASPQSDVDSLPKDAESKLKEEIPQDLDTAKSISASPMSTPVREISESIDTGKPVSLTEKPASPQSDVDSLPKDAESKLKEEKPQDFDTAKSISASPMSTPVREISESISTEKPVSLTEKPASPQSDVDSLPKDADSKLKEEKPQDLDTAKSISASPMSTPVRDISKSISTDKPVTPHSDIDSLSKDPEMKLKEDKPQDLVTARSISPTPVSPLREISESIDTEKLARLQADVDSLSVDTESKIKEEKPQDLDTAKSIPPSPVSPSVKEDVESISIEKPVSRHSHIDSLSKDAESKLKEEKPQDQDTTKSISTSPVSPVRVILESIDTGKPVSLTEKPASPQQANVDSLPKDAESKLIEEKPQILSTAKSISPSPVSPVSEISESISKEKPASPLSDIDSLSKDPETKLKEEKPQDLVTARSISPTPVSPLREITESIDTEKLARLQADVDSLSEDTESKIKEEKPQDLDTAKSIPPSPVSPFVKEDVESISIEKPVSRHSHIDSLSKDAESKLKEEKPLDLATANLISASPVGPFATEISESITTEKPVSPHSDIESLPKDAESKLKEEKPLDLDSAKSISTSPISTSVKEISESITTEKPVSPHSDIESLSKDPETKLKEEKQQDLVSAKSISPTPVSLVREISESIDTEKLAKLQADVDLLSGDTEIKEEKPKDLHTANSISPSAVISSVKEILESISNEKPVSHIEKPANLLSDSLSKDLESKIKEEKPQELDTAKSISPSPVSPSVKEILESISSEKPDGPHSNIESLSSDPETKLEEEKPQDIKSAKPLSTSSVSPVREISESIDNEKPVSPHLDIDSLRKDTESEMKEEKPQDQDTAKSISPSPVSPVRVILESIDTGKPVSFTEKPASPQQADVDSLPKDAESKLIEEKPQVLSTAKSISPSPVTPVSEISESISKEKPASPLSDIDSLSKDPETKLKEEKPQDLDSAKPILTSLVSPVREISESISTGKPASHIEKPTKLLSDADSLSKDLESKIKEEKPQDLDTAKAISPSPVSPVREILESIDTGKPASPHSEKEQDLVSTKLISPSPVSPVREVSESISTGKPVSHIEKPAKLLSDADSLSKDPETKLKEEKPQELFTAKSISLSRVSPSVREISESISTEKPVSPQSDIDSFSKDPETKLKDEKPHDLHTAKSISPSPVSPSVKEISESISNESSTEKPASPHSDFNSLPKDPETKLKEEKQLAPDTSKSISASISTDKPVSPQSDIDSLSKDPEIKLKEEKPYDLITAKSISLSSVSPVREISESISTGKLVSPIEKPESPLSGVDSIPKDTETKLKEEKPVETSESVSTGKLAGPLVDDDSILMDADIKSKEEKPLDLDTEKSISASPESIMVREISESISTGNNNNLIYSNQETDKLQSSLPVGTIDIGTLNLVKEEKTDSVHVQKESINLTESLDLSLKDLKFLEKDNEEFCGKSISQVEMSTIECEASSPELVDENEYINRFNARDDSSGFTPRSIAQLNELVQSPDLILTPHKENIEIGTTESTKAQSMTGLHQGIMLTQTETIKEALILDDISVGTNVDSNLKKIESTIKEALVLDSSSVEKQDIENRQIKPFTSSSTKDKTLTHATEDIKNEALLLEESISYESKLKQVEKIITQKDMHTIKEIEDEVTEISLKLDDSVTNENIEDKKNMITPETSVSKFDFVITESVTNKIKMASSTFDKVDVSKSKASYTDMYESSSRNKTTITQNTSEPKVDEKYMTEKSEKNMRNNVYLSKSNEISTTNASLYGQKITNEESDTKSIKGETDKFAIHKEDVSLLLKDNNINIAETVSKAFEDENVQQGIITESVHSLVFQSEEERPSTPPTVPVSPLPKTPSFAQDSDSVHSEISYDKSDCAEESITKIIHVGDDILTQKISTSTEKLPKPHKSSSDSSVDEITSLMHSMGKIKTETDTVTKIIKEGENLVTQTITTVTTKEVISREDGTPQNVKTTIETTTLSKNLDGSTTTTQDTQTILSECSSSLKSTSEMDLNAKDNKLDEKPESQITEKEMIFPESSSKSQKDQNYESSFVTMEYSDSEDNIEDTIIDTDVSKRIIKENNIDIIETVTTITKKETLIKNDTSKIVRTTIETNIVKERPDGSKDMQKNIQVSTEEMTMEKTIDESFLSKYTAQPEMENITTSKQKYIHHDGKISERTMITNTKKIIYCDDLNIPQNQKSIITVTTTDDYPDGSSETNVETNIIIETLNKESLEQKHTAKNDVRDIAGNITDLEISVSSKESCVDEENLKGYYCIGEPEVDTSSKFDIIEENSEILKRKTTITTVRQEYANSVSNNRKFKTTVTTIEEDEKSDGTVLTKTTEKVSIIDALLQSPFGSCDDVNSVECVEDTETVIDKSVDTKESNEVVHKENIQIKRTTTTKTTTETLKSDENVQRLRITVDTVTLDEYPDGSSESTRDVNVTISETKKIETKDLQPELDKLESTGVIIKTEEKQNNIVIIDGDEINQNITTLITKEELINKNTNNVAIKTVIETVTENTKKDGCIETKKDVQTQIVYLPPGVTFDEYTKKIHHSDEKYLNRKESVSFGDEPQSGFEIDSKSVCKQDVLFSDDDVPGSPCSTKSQLALSPRSNQSYEFDSKIHEFGTDVEQHNIIDPMSISVYGQLTSYQSDDTFDTKKHIKNITETFLTEERIQDPYIVKYDDSFLKEADDQFDKAIEEHKKVSGSDVISSVTAKYEISNLPSTSTATAIKLKDLPFDTKKILTTSIKTDESESKIDYTKTETAIRPEDPIASWGKPLGLPSPVMPNQDGKSTPKKVLNPVINKNKINEEKNKAPKRGSESPRKKKGPAPVYMELTYVPHHGNSYYSAIEFFKRVRARYYVFSGTEPSKEIYNALLDAKKTWEDKDLEVTIIPTYDTDVLGYWVTENEEALEKYKIDLSPSASRCTINLQDHETSCAAYRLEF